MKKLTILVASLVMAGFFQLVQAETPQPFPSPGYERPMPYSTNSFRYRGRIRVEKGMNEEGYQLRIYTSGDVDPEAIQVSIQGRSILIENSRSFQREERSEGEYYSYSGSSSSFRRRFSIPRYADAENMKSKVEEGVLTITLPYLNGYSR